jgi:hypothetical protein
LPPKYRGGTVHRRRSQTGGKCPNSAQERAKRAKGIDPETEVPLPDNDAKMTARVPPKKKENRKRRKIKCHI